MSEAISRVAITLMNGHDDSSPNKSKKGRLTHDVQKIMNIHHFEELNKIFQEESPEDSGGFDMDKFREVFGRVFSGVLEHDDITTLFMKIDANSDGTVTWDEFSTYMMMGSINSEEKTIVYEETCHQFLTGDDGKAHRDMIRMIEYVEKERKYVSVSQDGGICVWTQQMSLQKSIDFKECTGSHSWVSDAVCLYDQGKVATVNDDRRLYIFDIFSLKPRLLAIIGPFDHAPLKISYQAKVNDTQDMLLWGDDTGNVNFLFFTKRFFLDHVTENKPASVDPAKLAKQEYRERYGMTYKFRKCHKDWVSRVRYYPEVNSFVSSSANDGQKSLIIGELDRKNERSLRVLKGVQCFEFSKRPSFLITGGKDKVIRLWNPYVLSRPAGSLTGHLSGVMHMTLNHESGQLISVSEDKTIKIWSTRTLQCLQTLVDNARHRPMNIISAITFDSTNKYLIVGHESLNYYEAFKRKKEVLIKTHDAPVVSALYNESFHQVVSVCKNSVVRVWNPASSEKLFQFTVPGKGGITSMTFDKTHRRLITSLRSGEVCMWNFNNGQMLQRMKTESTEDITKVIYVQQSDANKYIVCVGWDKKVYLFLDDPGNFQCEPERVFTSENLNGISGHQADILCVDFLPGSANVMATGGVDGSIVIWNVESGHIKTKFQDPEINSRGQRDKAVEQLLFVYPRCPVESETPFNNYLISGDGDGKLRFWNFETGKLISEVNTQLVGTEGITSLYLSSNAKILVVGNTTGYVSLYNISGFQTDSQEPCKRMHFWKAHIAGITSAQYIESMDAILTSSVDGAVRVWTLKGHHVGTLGQSDEWDITNPASFAVYPPDVAKSKEDDPNDPERVAVEHHESDLKYQTLKRLRLSPLGITPEFQDLVEIELQAELHVTDVPIAILRERIILKAAAIKWKQFIKLQQSTRNHVKIAEKVIEEKGYFTFRELTEPKKSVSLKKVKVEATFQYLPCYEMQQITMPAKFYAFHAAKGKEEHTLNGHRRRSSKIQ